MSGQKPIRICFLLCRGILVRCAGDGEWVFAHALLPRYQTGKRGSSGKFCRFAGFGPAQERWHIPDKAIDNLGMVILIVTERDHVEGGGMGMRGGAVFHSSSISAGVRA